MSRHRKVCAKSGLQFGADRRRRHPRSAPDTLRRVPRPALTITLAATLALAAAGARLLLGGPTVGLPAPQYLEPRLLHVASAAAVGACLGVAGTLLQSLLRNPLASPDLLGVSSGASLAVMLGHYLAWIGGIAGWASGAWADGTAALIGATGALLLVYTLSQRRGSVDPVSMILIGVIVSILCSAFAALIQQLMPPDPARRSARWLFGFIDEGVSWAAIGAVASLAAAGTALAWWLGPAMDASAMSEEEARAVGVRIGRLRAAQFAAAGALTAGSVVLAGPIGFVGLVCPHLVRILAGPRHRPLVVGAALAGAAMVVGADAIVAAGSLVVPEIGRLQIGVVTALIGGPVFIAALRRQGRASLGA